MVNICDVLNKGRSLLKRNDIDEREARLLLAFSLDVSQNDLIKILEIDEKQFGHYLTILEKRISGMPYAYITGHKEFMKLDFIVNNNVLIPRDDTEILVEEAIKKDKKNILDMCTGSGAIAISLAKYVSQSNVTACDISNDALDVAKQNAKLNNVEVKFICSDLFKNIEGKFDMIVSNPPYIPRNDIEDLQIEVKNEPYIALDGGEDGLLFYKKIIDEAKNYLTDDGVLMFEIGYDQAQSVSKLLKDNNYKNIYVIKDLGENDRVVVAERGDM